MIGNICKLERDECAGCGSDVLLERFRALLELNEGDVFTESFNFVCATFSGIFGTAFQKNFERGKRKSLEFVDLQIELKANQTPTNKARI